MLMLLKNVGERFKFWSKIYILVKNLYFGQKFIFWSTFYILVKNLYFGKKLKEFQSEKSTAKI